MRNLVYLVISGCLAACAAPPKARDTVPTDPPPASGDGTPKSGDWYGLTGSTSPTARSGHTAVWTGAEMLIFGGQATTGEPLAAGSAFDPTTLRWTGFGSGNTPAARTGHTAVWTKTGMIVWGGTTIDGISQTPVDTSSGAIYDATAGTWQVVATHGAPTPRHGHTAVSTSSQMLVWGGNNGGHLGDGAAYDPVTDVWQDLPSEGAPSPRSGHTAVWTGTNMIIWGGVGDVLEATGASYDPSTHKWTALSDTGAPLARRDHTAVMVGGRMLIFGGLSEVGGTPAYLAAGGIYDPQTQLWSAMADVNAPTGRIAHTATANDTAMIIFGGKDNNQIADDGGMYDTKTDSWMPIVAPDHTPRAGHTAVWAANKMIAWGGYSGAGAGLDDGDLYQPPTSPAP